MEPNETLIVGWGNPGRGDDGLGPAFAEAIAGLAIPGVHVDSGYQLQVEMAATVADYRRVLFVDAERGTGEDSFWIEPLAIESVQPAFSTHSVPPSTVLALARDLFDSTPDAWLMGIRGYEFDDFVEGISPRAAVNLSAAVEFVQSALRQGAWGKRVDHG